MSVTAFCPGHISGYFKRVEDPRYGVTGSIGAGIVISEGVTATVSLSRQTTVQIRQRTPDGECIGIADRSPPLESALARIGVAAAVVTECTLPIGAGFGLSAAALLATLTAVNRAGSCGLDIHEITRIAHETEVKHRTGLGDVSACQGGGRVVRKGAGIDAPIDRFFDMDETICALSFGPIPTPAVLGSPKQMQRVAAAFPESHPGTVKEFFRLCLQFTEQSGLLTPEVAAVLRECSDHDVMASMTMLGNGVFAYGAGAAELLAGFGRVYRFRMADTSVRILEDRG